jgi:hypothetical protein
MSAGAYTGTLVSQQPSVAGRQCTADTDKTLRLVCCMRPEDRLAVD